MATLRVLFTWTLGRRWQEASQEAQEAAGKRWEALRSEWKADPGIRYICNFSKGVHHMLFEVDDATKAAEMGNAFYQANFPIDSFAFDLATGNTERDEYWAS